MDNQSVDRPCWFLGACFGGSDDQMQRFMAEGIWENGYQDRYIELVKEIQPGDQVAIKAAFTQRNNLPFDNRGHSVSAMLIKATGVVNENPGDGRHLKVKWTLLPGPRRWYFFTYFQTVWKVTPDSWEKQQLIEFTFEGKPQDIDRFRNEPFWKERFGDGVSKETFAWTKFYCAFADGLLVHKEDRSELIREIHRLAEHNTALSYLQDKFEDGSSGPPQDICPFTTMGIFNRGITSENRRHLAGELAKFLGVVEPVPSTFEGIPVLHNMSSWFYGYSTTRDPRHLNDLWEVFATAIKFSDSGEQDDRQLFMDSFNTSLKHYGVSWNLTCGLYWIRAWHFLSLDKLSRDFILGTLHVNMPKQSPKNGFGGSQYIALMEELSTRFKDANFPVHSFPELSLAAWKLQTAVAVQLADVQDSGETAGTAMEESESNTYGIEDILSDGCFLSRAELEEFLHRFRLKKNLILQGPPGTGKTWLARRLGYALMGSRDETRLRAVQFHPNLSYEDFVRGWRPSGNGLLELVEGPFMEMVEAAHNRPDLTHVLLIEEINRGNPAQILGEMLTLLEPDKRHPHDALELSYKRLPGEKVYLPSNFHVIGTMNVADRSLALVDLALRRRFAFIELEPNLGESWKTWVASRHRIEIALLEEIERRMKILNELISSDMSLGRQFRVGHSYVTPGMGAAIADGRHWFRGVVQSEIGPLMDEYWFDSPEKAKEARRILTDGLE